MKYYRRQKENYKIKHDKIENYSRMVGPLEKKGRQTNYVPAVSIRMSFVDVKKTASRMRQCFLNQRKTRMKTAGRIIEKNEKHSDKKRSSNE